jgi:hypothetical protein
LRRSLQIQTELFNTNNSKERERERDEGDDGEKSSRAFVANDDHRRLGEQSARRNRRRRDE